MNKKLPNYEANKLAYKLEGLRRAKLRKNKRKLEREQKYYRYGQGDATCSMCGGAMTWCSGCQVWSSTCCCDYGTCECS
jgi:hypothetical protein